MNMNAELGLEELIVAGIAPARVFRANQMQQSLLWCFLALNQGPFQLGLDTSRHGFLFLLTVVVVHFFSFLVTGMNLQRFRTSAASRGLTVVRSLVVLANQVLLLSAECGPI